MTPNPVDIHDHVGLAVEEKEENDNEAFDPNANTTITPSITTPITAWMVGDADIASLFREYRIFVNTIDIPLHLETSLKELLSVAGILFLAPNDYSPTMMNVFGQRTLNDLSNQLLNEFMPATTPKISDSDFIKVINTISTVDNKTISVREGKRDLLNLAATMNSTMGNVVEGLANL